MSENKIYEITRLMQSPDALKNDVTEAMEIVAKHFRNKYILPIEQEVRCCSEQCKKEPIKEAVLLEACRPFVRNTKNIDFFLDIINSISVVERLMPRQSIKALSAEDSSIHKDGIYDIDKSCQYNRLNIAESLGINPIFIVIILLAFQ